MKKVPYFTEEEAQQIQRAASRVWDEVAYDCLQATAEEKGRNIDSITIPRSQVIEIALDAGRPEEQLRRMKLPELADKLRDCQQHGVTYRQLINVVKPAFPFTRYGT